MKQHTEFQVTKSLLFLIENNQKSSWLVAAIVD
jgi:hypothetical protein